MDFLMPAEWEEHTACWVAWPSHAELWGEDLPDVQREFVALCRAIAQTPAGGRAEKIHLLVPNAAREQEAISKLEGLPVQCFRIPFGDIWLRDTAPIFLSNGQSVSPACFKFNGWGGKYNLPHDGEVSQNIAKASGKTSLDFDWILEGGSVEVDGQGTCLTTEQCLLNRNRNPELNRSEIEEKLKGALGVGKILWLREGLLNDHTDGHIDTLARFVAPGKVVCMQAQDKQDPNAKVLDEIAATLTGFTDARGRRLEVVRIPSPGKVTDSDGKILAASYVNFYISNASVVVPVYGKPADEVAVQSIARLFPNRSTVGLSAQAILRGGGAFHCITQQQPACEEKR